MATKQEKAMIQVWVKWIRKGEAKPTEARNFLHDYARETGRDYKQLEVAFNLAELGH